MRRGSIILGATSLVAAALFAIPAAYAGSPVEIANDLADGRLDGSYTQAELSSYLQNATIQGYGNPVPTTPTTPTVPAGGIAPVVTPITPVVAGAQSPVRNRPAPKPAPAAQTPVAAVAGAQSPPLAATQSTGTLPFTGVDLALLVAGGAFMLGLGLVARRLGRSY